MLCIQHFGPPEKAPKKEPKKEQASGGVPGATFDDFWSILASSWDARGAHFRHFGHHFGGPKKGSKNNIKKNSDPVGPADCAGLLGGFGRVNILSN